MEEEPLYVNAKQYHCIPKEGDRPGPGWRPRGRSPNKDRHVKFKKKEESLLMQPRTAVSAYLGLTNAA